MDRSESGVPAFGLLGPLELIGTDGRVRALSGRQMTTLALLAVRANRVVAIDNLVDALWEEAPPITARAQVQFCIHALRQEIDKLGIPAKIVTQAPGYRLDVAEDQLDSTRFQDLVTGARQLEGADAVASLRKALGLWRGPVLDGTARLVREQVTWLDELRIEVLEECLGLELDLARHREVIGELRGLVAEHPLNEKFRYKLMLALYRADRANEALEVYRAGRVYLVEQLGLDPGEKLQQLQAAILAEDKALLGGSRGPSHGLLGGWTPPKQLPADTPDLTGRAALVSQLLAELDPPEGARALPIVNITGKAGVGKSVLAVHVAHELAERFPDGQLYVNLGACQAQPSTPRDVLGTLLRTLGLGGAAIPDSVADRAATYRSVLAERSVLLVFEDAADEAQVRPLLPATRSCAVLVTSRAVLAGLPGVSLVRVGELCDDHALELLGKLIGPARVAREQDQAKALLEVIGGLPLALRIVGAKMAARPHWTLRSMVGRLVDEGRRLDELAHGELGVRSSLMMSYTGLDPRSAQLMDRLGVLDTESLPSWTAPAVLDDDGQQAFDLLDRLVDAQLLDVVATDEVAIPRYRFRDLIRIFARERLREHEPEVSGDVLRRVMGGWLCLAEVTHQRLYGGDFNTLHGTARRRPVPVEHVHEAGGDPLHWFEQERANICAAIAQAAGLGFDELCWDLAVTLVSLFEVRSSFDEWSRSHEDALRATTAAGNVRGSAALRCSLGSLYITTNRLGLARTALTPAFETFAELGDVHGIALVSRNLALLERQAGAPRDAESYNERALDGFTRVGDPVGQAAVLCQMAQIELDGGRHEAALGLLDRALLVGRDVASSRIQAQARYKLGKVQLALGDYDAAGRIVTEVLALVRESGDRQGESYALHLLGVIQRCRGRLGVAARLLAESAVHCERNFDRVGAARSSLDLARVERLRGRPDAARELALRAREIFAEFGLPRWVEAAARVADGDPPDRPVRRTPRFSAPQQHLGGEPSRRQPA